MKPLFIFGILDGLGFSEKLLVGGFAVLFILYLFRMRRMVGKSANVASTLWLVGLTIGASTALAVFLGWVDPFPQRFIADLSEWFRTTFDFILGPVDDFFRGLIP